MSSHLRRLPWWRRWRVLAPSVVSGVTAVAVGAGVYGLAPVSATESRPRAPETTPRSSQTARPTQTTPRVTFEVAVAQRTADLRRTKADVASLARRARVPAGWGRNSDRSDPFGWRSHTWRLVQSASVQIPYGAGKSVSRSLIELSRRGGSLSVWFLDVRAPSDVGGATAWQGPVASIETKLAAELRADGTPVVFVGNGATPIDGAGVHFASSTSGGLVEAVGTVG